MLTLALFVHGLAHSRQGNNHRVGLHSHYIASGRPTVGAQKIFIRRAVIPRQELMLHSIHQRPL